MKTARNDSTTALNDFPAAGAAAASGRLEGEIFGHPKCLFTLFFAEMWERFSFYGMKALLILYMVNYLFWTQESASHVMAWYAGLVYATPILGGIVADKLLGARWSVVIGGVLIAIGHFLLAFEPLPFFYSGLGFLIVGTGFLKPNISTQVGALYRAKDDRRDSAFTIFYMGINTGAFLGPLVCEALRVNINYHAGFAAAGVGMVIGLIVYIAGMGSVVRREKMIRELEAKEAGGGESRAAAADAVNEKGVPMSRVYAERAVVLVIICLFAVLFWVGFEQAANVMNLWADKHTNLWVFRGEPKVALAADGATGAFPAYPSDGGLSDWQMGPAATQSINPGFIISLAALFAWLWTFLDKRGLQPSTPMKMALGVFFLTLGYGAVIAAAQRENGPTSAPLAAVPQGLSVEPDGRVVQKTDGAVTNFGATRLRYEAGTLHMRGVLTDLDWTRVLGATANPEFAAAVNELKSQASAAAEKSRVAHSTAAWKVEVPVPATAGDPVRIAGWPEAVGWNAATRTLTATAVIPDREFAQLLAAAADPAFRDAATKIYVESSKLRVSIFWLLLFYFLVTVGELCLSPVGLSLVTKAAHPKFVGLFMGIWFFTTGALANYSAHFVGGYWGNMTPTEYFMIFGAIAAGATVLMLLMLRFLKPMLHGIH